MALIQGTATGLKHQSVVYVNSADDLLLQIPSIPILSTLGGKSRGRYREVITKTALNFLQKSILLQEPPIMRKILKDKENVDLTLIGQPIIFRSFGKACTTLMAPMVSSLIERDHVFDPHFR